MNASDEFPFYLLQALSPGRTGRQVRLIMAPDGNNHCFAAAEGNIEAKDFARALRQTPTGGVISVGQTIPDLLI